MCILTLSFATLSKILKQNERLYALNLKSKYPESELNIVSHANHGFFLYLRVACQVTGGLARTHPARLSSAPQRTMSSALLQAQSSHRPVLSNLSLTRTGRQQRLAPLTKRQPQRARSSVISNVATAPLPPPADISTPARPQQVVIRVLL